MGTKENDEYRAKELVTDAEMRENSYKEAKSSLSSAEAQLAEAQSVADSAQKALKAASAEAANSAALVKTDDKDCEKATGANANSTAAEIEVVPEIAAAKKAADSKIDAITKKINTEQVAATTAN